MLPRSRLLAEKSLAACTAAIDAYNKPDFKYREETFVILMVNAWELLLKAKLLKSSSNRLKSIYRYEHHRLANGRLSRKKYLKKNRAGNPMSIDIMEAISRLRNDELDEACVANLESLIEIRDNAVHFANVSLDFTTEVLSLSVAAVRNYVTLARDWFFATGDRFGFCPMPLSFLPATVMAGAPAPRTNTETRRFLKYLARLGRKYPSDESKPFSLSLRLDCHFASRAEGAPTTARLTTEPTAPEVRITDTELITMYPVDHQALVAALRQRCPGFKLGRAFYAEKRQLEQNPRYCHVRHLNPTDPTSSAKKFYSTAMVDKLVAVCNRR
jgi:hypothetical protein